jgi:rfaE bifunctional protein kinase chain/domain
MSNNKTVFVSGNFNVLHPGHMRLLRFAKEYGDHLIVAVESDRLAGKLAYVPEKLRLEGVSSNSWVDEAILIDEPVSIIIERLRPDIVVKGNEHQSRFNPEKRILESYGAQLLFCSGEIAFSSIDLLRKEFYQSTMSDINIPLEYLARHSIEPIRLVNLLERFNSLKVCIVGDLIVDEYITCEPLGMSQEEPTIVVTPVDTTRFIGGAGIVAAHAAGLGAQVEFITISGVDEARDYVQDALVKAKVNAHIIEDNSRPTTLKQRFRSKGKSLLRVSHLHQTAISPALQSQIMNVCESVIQNIDLLVFSDFNYGCLPESLVDKISSLAKSNNVMMAADSQSSSQVGNIARFTEMEIITPTEREARISTRNNEDGLVVLAEKLQKQSSARNILLKIGEEGLLIHTANGNSKDNEWMTDRVHALNSAPRDVAGAGDSLLIGSALTMASGGNIWEAAVMGSLVAAVQVSRVGNTPLQANELLQELK